LDSGLGQLECCPNRSILDLNFGARFNTLHAEKLPSAIERYANEIKRVLGVLERCLAGRQWLVGDKCTFADLSFVTWNEVVKNSRGKLLGDFPNVEAWHDRMVTRDSFKKCMEIREKLMDEQGLMPNGMPKGVNNMAEYEAKMKREGDL
jgi:glutathione S-transferase